MSKNAIIALLVLLFAYTGFSKFFALQAFTGTMYNQPIPHWMAAPLVGLIPVAEVTAAGCLLFKKTQRTGLYLSLLLLILFTLYIAAILLHFFRRTPCSCGGIFRNLSWQQHLWVNLLLLAFTAIAITRRPISSYLSPLN